MVVMPGSTRLTLMESKKQGGPHEVEDELNDEEDSKPSVSDLVRVTVPNNSETHADHKV